MACKVDNERINKSMRDMLLNNFAETQSIMVARRRIFFDDDDDPYTDPIDIIEEFTPDKHIPDMNLPVIDLKKEKPAVVKQFISHTFRMQDVTDGGCSAGLYENNCIAYAFKDGKLFLTFNMDTEDGRHILFRKKMLRRVRITHYSGDAADATPDNKLVYDCVISFSHIEANASSSDNDYDYAPVTLTLVYKIDEY